MKIRKEFWTPFSGDDPESELLVKHFDEPPGSSVLEVGGNDSPLALSLASSGFRVVSCDLKPYPSFPGLAPRPDAHTHVVGDFCSWPTLLRSRLLGRFDCAVSVSALEHFGLGTYGEAGCELLDAFASRLVYEHLRPGGVFYVVVPVGGRYVRNAHHWRVYDWAALIDRVVHDFHIDFVALECSEKAVYMGEDVSPGDSMTWPQAMMNVTGWPGVAALLKLCKNPKERGAVP